MGQVSESVTLDVMKLINELEGKWEVNEWDVNGVKIWPIIRNDFSVQIGDIILGHPYDNRTVDIKNSSVNEKISMLSKVIKNYINQKKSYFKDWSGNDFSKKADHLFLSFALNKSKMGGMWYDRFSGIISRELNKKGQTSLILEFTDKNEWRIPRGDRSRFIQSSLDLIGVKSVLFKKNISYSLEKYEDFIHEVNSTYKVNLPRINSLVSKIRRIELLSKYFEDLLKETQAKVAYVVCYYTIHGFAFSLAASKLGIPMVDIQHGVQNSHPSYANWQKVPDTGYQLLPKHFWCWSHEDTASINKWAHQSRFHNAFTGGVPWIAACEQGGNHAFRAFVERVRSKTEEQRDKKHVLISLGWRNESIFLELVKQSADTCYWWVRLHPSMFETRDLIKKEYSQFANVEVDLATDTPLPLLLHKMDFHLTMISSVILEASSMSVPSITLDPSAIAYYRNEIDSGWCKYIENPSEIVDYILTFDSKKLYVEDSNHSQKFQDGIIKVSNLMTDCKNNKLC